MNKCDNCGNEYEKTFKVVMFNLEHTFDCFECAINKLAPICSTCGTKIIGHGLENQLDTYCCAACARVMGESSLKDHAENPMNEILP